MFRNLQFTGVARLTILAGLALSACSVPGPAEQSAPAPAEGGARPGGAAVAEASVATAPLAAPSSGGATMLTRLTAEETGIVHQNYLPLEQQAQYIYVGGGVAADDYDGDGKIDLYLVSEVGQNKLYRNLGNWQFEDVTERAGVDIPRKEQVGRWKQRFPTGAYFADVDNDGDPDLFVTAFAGSTTLFRNDGNGHFTDVTDEAGVRYVGGSTAATFADYDRDGDLDFYLATYRPYAYNSVYPPESLVVMEPELNYDVETAAGFTRLMPETDHLYRNKGDGTFEDVADAAGVGGRRDWGLAARFADATGDGWPDLYVANDFGTPDRFYLNQRDGTFKEASPQTYRHSSWFSMGMDFGDINNDGYLDFMSTDMLSPSRRRRNTQTISMMLNPLTLPPTDSAPQQMRNCLQLANGDGTYSDIALFAGVEATDWTWSLKFADMDLDGFQDIMITNGFVNDTMNGDVQTREAVLKQRNNREEIVAFKRALPRLLTPNMAYRNEGDLRFEEVSQKWGFTEDEVSNGLTLADLDGDGDLDAVANNMNAPVDVYRNDASAHRLMVRLVGKKSNRDGLGARLTWAGPSGKQVREMTNGGGYLSSHEPVVVFGLGQSTDAGELTVEWPSGFKSTVPAAADQLLTITEPEGEPAIPPPPVAQPTQFEAWGADKGLAYQHQDPAFNDFAREPLLPLKLSQLGPGVAWGDANGDGWDDLYIAGSTTAKGGLFMSAGGQSFTAGAAADPPGGGLEEQAPLWLATDPANGADLVISLASYEAAAGPQRMARRFVSTNGAFNTAEIEATSDASSGTLAAADYDGDGDLDLFVGGRVGAGSYPKAVSSHLLKNDSSTFAAADGDAPGLASLGLVTGALWTDVDGDGDPDLVLATDWGDPRLFTNDGGKLSDATAGSGFAGHQGWWRGIDAGDVDHDGDLDLVMTNLGLNTRYRPQKDQPVTLFAGDLDGDGNNDLVETEWEAGKLYPTRHAEELMADTTGFIQRFTSYSSLANATVDDIFGLKLQTNATRFTANWMEHSLFVNDGQGHFTAKALPTAAQLTTGYGVVLADLDDDGHDDIYLVGNHFSAEPMHNGPFDAGISVLLRGDGKGDFTAVSPVESGLSVPLDAKGLAATDIDHDGWLDLAVGNNNGPLVVYRNKGVSGRKGLALRLVGNAPNAAAVGAKVTVARADGVTMTKEVHAGSSYLSQNGRWLVFGLGEAAGPVKVSVRWPDGKETVNENVSPGAVEITPSGVKGP